MRLLVILRPPKSLALPWIGKEVSLGEDCQKPKQLGGVKGDGCAKQGWRV